MQLHCFGRSVELVHLPVALLHQELPQELALVTVAVMAALQVERTLEVMARVEGSL